MVVKTATRAAQAAPVEQKICLCKIKCGHSRSFKKCTVLVITVQ